MTHQGLQLRNDLRQAVENYMGSMVTDPWDTVIEEMARAIEEGCLLSAEAAKLDLALRRTQGADTPDCLVCGCVMPGQEH